jgi:hypothetical protein
MLDSTHTLIKNNIKCMAWAKNSIHAYDLQSQAKVEF